MTPKHAKLQIFFQQVFIVLETFTVGIKAKNLPRTGVSGCFIRWPPVQDDHFWVVPKMVVLYRSDCIKYLIKWSLCTGFLKKSACQMWKLPWEKSTFYKVCRSCEQLYEVCRICQQLHKICRICQQLYKFVGLTNNFWKVCYTCKKFMKFVDWKLGFKCLKVFLWWNFPR